MFSVVRDLEDQCEINEKKDGRDTRKSKDCYMRDINKVTRSIVSYRNSSVTHRNMCLMKNVYDISSCKVMIFAG